MNVGLKRALTHVRELDIDREDELKRLFDAYPLRAIADAFSGKKMLIKSSEFVRILRHKFNRCGDDYPGVCFFVHFDADSFGDFNEMARVPNLVQSIISSRFDAGSVNQDVWSIGDQELLCRLVYSDLPESFRDKIPHFGGDVETGTKEEDVVVDPDTADDVAFSESISGVGDDDDSFSVEFMIYFTRNLDDLDWFENYSKGSRLQTPIGVWSSQRPNKLRVNIIPTIFPLHVRWDDRFNLRDLSSSPYDADDLKKRMWAAAKIREWLLWHWWHPDSPYVRKRAEQICKEFNKFH